MLLYFYMTTSVQRLRRLFAPSHYTLHINLTEVQKRRFSGSVTILGDLQQDATAILLHAKQLEITLVTIDDQPAVASHGENNELTVTSNQPLAKGTHKLQLEFTGTITDPMHGLYPCYFTINGEQKELFATQFESHHAREVFPCIDEPAAKASIDLTLTTRPHITTLANTPVTSKHIVDDTLVTTFGTTPKMSTYLLAFVVGELDYREATTTNGVTVRAYATPDKVAQTQFAVDFAAKVLDFYDEYFDLPYPLQKCDMVALPDFSSGAMENWGLVTYREACLLVDEGNTPADTKQYVATVIAHELAHQWFGNLVTMEWWDDLWLNESFANWMEHVAVSHFYPDWQMWEQFGASEQLSAFTRDGLATVQAVQQHVHHPDEIRSMFDGAIVYAKGACLIRMLHEYLGADVFRNGLRLYMERHQYDNTQTTDLWAALSEVSGKNVTEFMQPWVEQPGHPVVNVAIDDGHATLTQRRFYADPEMTSKKDETLWPVPLLSDAIPDTEILSQASTRVVAQPDSLGLINVGGTGFYHVHYTAEHLANIAKAVANNELTPVDRQRLLIDALALTRAGLEKTTNTLALLANYSKEENYSVWLAMASIIGTLKVLVADDHELKTHLRRYTGNLARQEFTRLGWQPIKNESYFDELLRPIVIGCMAYAKDPAVIAHSLHLYDAAQKPEDIPADVRSIVYSVAVRERGEPAFTRLLGWYKETTSAEERLNLCAGITSMKEEALVKKALALIPTKTVKLQDTAYWFVYIMRNPHGRDLAWEWMKDNWQWIYDNFNSDMHYTDFPRYASGGFSTREQLAEYKEYFTPKLNEPSIARTIRQGFEEIAVRAAWRERDLAEISAFLKKI